MNKSTLQSGIRRLRFSFFMDVFPGHAPKLIIDFVDVRTALGELGL
jgi:hypothetical protein